MISNLETLSVEFKRDCLAFLLNDALAAKTALPKLPDDFFEHDPEYHLIFTAFKDFIINYQNRPSRHELIDYIKDWCIKGKLDDDKIKVLLLALDKLWDWGSGTNFNPVYIREKLYDAIKSHEILKVLKQTESYIEEGKYDDLVEAMSKARYSVSEEESFTEYWTDTTSRIERLRRKRAKVIPTNMAPVDDLIDGGMTRGGLGMVMAGSGRGKTAILGQLAVQASLQGFTVAYITLEASADEIMKRCDSHNSGIPVSDIPIAKRRKIAEGLHQVYTTNKQTPGPFFVQYYPTKSISVRQVEDFVERIREEKGLTLDLLVLDYFDLLKMTGTYTKKYEALEENIEILRGLAGKYNMAIWTASQINRGGVGKETVDMDDIASGFGKVFPLDLLITISQTKQEKVKNVFRFYFAKNRYGPGGEVVFVEPDFERMRFNALTKEEAQKKGLYVESTTSSKKGSKSGATAPATSFGNQGP